MTAGELRAKTLAVGAGCPVRFMVRQPDGSVVEAAAVVRGRADVRKGEGGKPVVTGTPELVVELRPVAATAAG